MIYLAWRIRIVFMKKTVLTPMPGRVLHSGVLSHRPVKLTRNSLAPQNRFEMRFTANHVSRCVIAEHAVTKKRIMLGIIAFDRSTDDWQGQQPVAAICKAHFESHPGSQNIFWSALHVGGGAGGQEEGVALTIVGSQRRTLRPRFHRETLRRSAPFHFLHDSFVVGQHHNAKSPKLLSSQRRNEGGKQGVQCPNAFMETEFVTKKPFHYGLGFAFVLIHDL